MRAIRRRGAFTVIELLIVIVTMAILAGLAIPSFSSTLSERRAWAAAERIRADLQWARQHAISTSTPQPVMFSADGYVLPGMRNLDNTSDEYKVDLSNDAYQVRLVSADLGGDQALVFDIYGNADSAAQIVIAAGEFTKIINVQEITGAVSVR
jgi:Tfp pilus assembly protein FimT